MKNHSRRARRRAALLTLLMMVGPTPTMGDQPDSQSTHWMPPLPLSAQGPQSSQGAVQPNPFCQAPESSSAPSSAGTEHETVQLASGRPPLVQLKPVGSAVGLVPIDDASGRHQRSAIGVTDPASPAKVQVNPLVKAPPHAPAPPARNAPHVEPEATADGAAAAQTGGNAVTKEAVSFSLSDQPSTDLPDPAQAEEMATPDPTGPQSATAEPKKIASSGGKAARDVNDVSPPKASADAQPPKQPEPSAQPKIVSPRPMLVQEAAPIAISGAASEEVAPDRQGVSPDREVASRTQKTPRRADRPAAQPAGESQRLAAEADASSRSTSEPGRVASRAESTERPSRAATAAQRYRPPVAIAAPPLAVERPATEPAASIVRPTVKTVAALKLDSTESDRIERSQPHQESRSVFETNSPGASDSQHAQLHLDPAQVRSLTIGGKLRRVQVADDRICQAIATGANELKLIGVSDGLTQLSVWADPADGGETQQRIFSVHVGSRAEPAGHSIGDTIAMLNRSIDNAFPMAQVTVRQLRDRLVVSGHCGSEDSATEIIRLVRKTCLIPVRDELVVR